MKYSARALPEVLHDLVVIHAFQIGANRRFDNRLQRRRACELTQQPAARYHSFDVAIGGQIVCLDPGFLQRVVRDDFQMAATAGPARLKRRDETGERIRVEQRAFVPGVCGRVGDRVQIELQVGSVDARSAAYKSAELVYAQA